MKAGGWLTLAIAALAAAAVAPFAGCAAPPDAAWLRLTGFQKAGTGTGISSVEVPLDDPVTTTSVDAVLENQAVIVGTDSGVGIDVYESRVEYGDPTFPSFSFPMTLFIAPGHGTSSTGDSSGTVSVPVAPAALKSLVRATRAVPLAVSARVTFKARTEEGRELVTSGGLLLNFVPEPFTTAARARL
jgi:hypothetical protein